MEHGGHRWLRWPVDPDRPRLAFGADYNPEQWPRAVLTEDVRAMREAGVNIVSLAIFSWARVQPGEEVWDFGWLDEIMDLLHANDIAVDLATATASPPPWLTSKHPEILPVDREGRTIWPGARQHWRPTSPVFRDHALRLVRAMAERYCDHPALAAWHISNELGCHNAYDYSDDAAVAFRAWLRARYQTMSELNRAWATTFWSQHYSDWEQILPPRWTGAGTYPNPTQQLDFRRFSSDALKQYLRAERSVLREFAPGVPVTTNFMVMAGSKSINYADWAGEVDFIANDHYVLPGQQSLDELSFSANLVGNLADGHPWFLMEHSTSAVNWQPINRAKSPGELIRDSLTHVAHGADAICFFQWRQSAGGAEKFHSAMVPHCGEDSAVFRAVVELGATLRDLAAVAGTRRTPASAAILFDWESWWGSEQDSHPTDRLRYRQEALDWYTAFLQLGIRADVVPLDVDLSRYQLVIAPVLYMVPAALAARLTEYVAGGGHLVTTYFAGVVDADEHVWLGGYPGALRDLLGIRVEEYAPLLDDECVELDNGLVGTLWTDRMDLTDRDTEVLARYRTGDSAGRPAITRRQHGSGSAAYVSTRLGPTGIVPVLKHLADRAGIDSDLPPDLRGAVELTVRGSRRFLINRTNRAIDVSSFAGSDTTLAPRAVIVV